MATISQIMSGRGSGTGQQTKSQPRNPAKSGFLDPLLYGSGQSVDQQHLKQPQQKSQVQQPSQKSQPKPNLFSKIANFGKEVVGTVNKATQNPVVKTLALTNPITAPIVAGSEVAGHSPSQIVGSAIQGATETLTGAPKHAAAPTVQDVNPKTKQLTPQFLERTGTTAQQFKPKSTGEKVADLAQGVVNIDAGRAGFGGEDLLTNVGTNAIAGGTAGAASSYASGERGKALEKSAVGGALTAGALGLAGHVAGEIAGRHPSDATKVNLANTATNNVKPKSEAALETLSTPAKSAKEIAPLAEKAPVPKPRDEQIIEAAKARTEEPTVSTFEGVQPIPAPTAESKPLTPIGEGATKTSKLASGVETNAVEKKLTTSLGDLPEYKQVNMKDQAARSTHLLESEPDRAIRIATGQERAPDDVLPESIFTAVENKAVNEGDVETLRQLASGTRPGEATAYGQHIRALAERDPNSVVGAIKEIADSRGASADKQAIKTAASEIKKSIPRVREKDWNSFAESLAC